MRNAFLIAGFDFTRPLPIACDVLAAKTLLLLSTVRPFSITEEVYRREPIPAARPGLYLSLTDYANSIRTLRRKRVLADQAALGRCVWAGIYDHRGHLGA